MRPACTDRRPYRGFTLVEMIISITILGLLAAVAAPLLRMPLAVYLALEQDLDAAIVLSLVLLVVSVAILAGLRDRWLGGGTR